jgi:hypothetical protein
VVKKAIFALTAVACFGAAASQAAAQYQTQPQYLQPYSPYAAQASRPAANQPAAGYQAAGYQARPAYPVQQTAMRPSTNTYAATPSSNFALKPLNPPSPATQRILMANRTQPTPAPAQGAAGAPTAARSTVRLPPSPAQANWNAPPYASNDNGAAAYGSGGMGAAPVNAQPDAGQNYGPVAGGAAPCEGGDCNGDGCGIGRCCGLGSLCCCGGLGHVCCIRSTGDLVQHTPFFGTTHGYYYFRPYHVMHVFSQQELATRWGGDPRNPYDNTIFQKTYEMMGVDIATIKAREEAAAKAKAAGLADPAPDYSVPNINSVPTPLPGGYQGQMNYGPQGVPPAAYPPGAGFQGGLIPQGAMPNMQAPSIEYVPQR